MKITQRILVLILVCAAAIAGRGQSTGFTYAGRLAANGAPYTGLAEMQFALFSSPTGGVAVATSAPSIASVNVTGGLFTVLLDFGAGAFTGVDRFLEMQVRTNSGAFSTLKARQPLTPTPYALYARLASPWSISGSDTFYIGGNVGLGTVPSGAGLHIKKEAIPPGGTLALEGVTHTYLTFFPEGSAAGRKGYFGFASANPRLPSSSTTDMTIANESPGGRIVLFERSGALFPAAGEDNLRIVRGIFLGNAAQHGGFGFSVTRRANGRYTVTFDTPFAGQPTVMAIPETTSEGVRFSLMVNSVASDSFRIESQGDCDSGSEWCDVRINFFAIGPR